MRVLYVIATFDKRDIGSAPHIGVGLEFLAHGHSFSVLALRSDRKQNGQKLDTSEHGIRVHRATVAGKPQLDLVNTLTSPIFRYSRFVTGSLRFAEYSRRQSDFEVAIVEGAYPLGAMFALATIGQTRPFIVTVSGGDFISSQETEYGYARFRQARAMMRMTFRRAAAIRATSPLAAEHIVGLGANLNKTRVVPYNLAAESYIAPEESLKNLRLMARAEIGQRYSLGPGPLLLGVGRLLPIKGFDDAVRALPGIRQRFPDAQLLLVGPDRITGEGNFREILGSLADQLGVGRALIFAGEVEHEKMKTIFASADLLLVPSIIESMNRAAAEAAAVGTPAIVTCTAGIAGMGRDDGPFIVIEPHSQDQLANQACTLLSDSQRWLTLSRAGQEFATRFTAQRIGADLMSLCEDVMTGGIGAYANPIDQAEPR